MRVRILAAVWLAVGVAVWCGFFDFYIERGASEFLRRHARQEVGPGGDAPSLAGMMSDAARRGAIAASVWATIVAGCGWATIWVVSPSNRDVRLGR